MSDRKCWMIFGKPGAGKGTHGPSIEEKCSIPQLSTGDMLRAAVAAGTEIGKQAKAKMEAGELVTDEIVIGIIKDEIKSEKCKGGFLLDGFPRTVAQAKALDVVLAESGEKINKILYLNVDSHVLEERICGRWIHKPSGRSYHVKFARPKSLGEGETATKENMKDDETGEALIQRADDTAEALCTRLDAFAAETNPILDHYRAIDDSLIVEVDAGQAMDAVAGAIADICK